MTVDSGGSAAQAAWDSLAVPWQAAFTEAWASWCSGCFGIGAVAVDRNGAIVARGRNRILEPKSEPGILADSFTAHAEMNVLAALSWGQTDIELYTTLEPCLMCAATIVMTNVPVVHYAGSDPLFAGIVDVLDQHPFVAERRHERHGPMDDAVGRFARLLPLTFVAFWMGADALSIQAANDADADLAALAMRVAGDETLTAVKEDGGSTADAMASVWGEIA